MCYNITAECRINIKSSGNGWRDETESEGFLSITGDGAVSLEYGIRGDKCLLTAGGGRVVQERNGDQNLTLTFIEGERTSCVIGRGGLRGSFEIYTKSIELKQGKGGIKLALAYISGADGEEIHLTLTAAVYDRR